MDRATVRRVRERAGGHCEYCRLPEALSGLPHVMEHVIARQHGGGDAPDDLALACVRCNQFKGPNIAGLDPQGGVLTRLFHPRLDRWDEHFEYDGPLLRGTTGVGRTTVRVLAINLPLRVAARRALIDEGHLFESK